jgi:hypothetical protein
VGADKLGSGGVWVVMSPRKRKANPAIERKMATTLTAEEATTHYHFEVNPIDKESMSILEKDVRAVRTYTE